MSRALQAIDRALAGARQSAARQAKAAKHCIGGEARRAQLQKSADELRAHADELERARNLVARLIAERQRDPYNRRVISPNLEDTMQALAEEAR